MGKACCKFHNKMEFEDTDLAECGMAGMGRPTVCCRNCPENIYPDGMADYYNENEGKLLT